MRSLSCSIPMLLVLLGGFAWATHTVQASEPGGEMIGVFESGVDVGNISRPGSVEFDPDEQIYRIAGSGQNMWSNHDDFYFVWRRLRGDFILRARIAFEGEGAHPHRKLGWIVRSGLEPDAPHAALAVHGDGLTALQFRRRAGAETEELRL